MADSTPTVPKRRTTAAPAATLVLDKVKTDAAMDATTLWFPDKSQTTQLLTGAAAGKAGAVTLRDAQDTIRTIRTHAAATGTTCFWCLRPVPPGAGVGCPVIDLTRSEGTFCGHNRYACVFAWLLREWSVPVSKRNPVLSESCGLLWAIYRSRYGDKQPMQPAADYRLLKQNGGDMESEAYDQTTSSAFYAPTSFAVPIQRTTARLAGSSGTALINQSILYPALVDY